MKYNPMPKELIDYINSLPSSSVNNTRKIIRSTWRSIRHLHPVAISNIMQKYGINLDPDRTAKDYGGEPNYNGEE